MVDARPGTCPFAVLFRKVVDPGRQRQPRGPERTLTFQERTRLL